MTKVLQDTELTLPDLITICLSSQKTVKKLRKLLDMNGPEVFEKADIFPVCSSFLSSINREDADLFPDRRTPSTTNENFDNYLFNNYLIKGSKEAASHQCLHEFRKIIEKRSLTGRVQEFHHKGQCPKYSAHIRDWNHTSHWQRRVGKSLFFPVACFQ